MKQTHRGYTLIELTVTLLILGVVGIFLARWVASFNEQRRYGQQRELIQRADEALTAFAVGRARLPCPASSITVTPVEPCRTSPCFMRSSAHAKPFPEMEAPVSAPDSSAASEAFSFSSTLLFTASEKVPSRFSSGSGTFSQV